MPECGLLLYAPDWNTDLWLPSITALGGVALGGAISYVLSRQQIRAAREQRLEGEWSDGTRRPRKNRLDVLMRVRAFYLDMQEWALEYPSWAPWAVPRPVRRGDTDGQAKHKRAFAAEMHQRIRERLPPPAGAARRGRPLSQRPGHPA